MAKSKIIIVKVSTTHRVENRKQDYISFTGNANAKESENRTAGIIKNRIRKRAILEFLGIRESVYNPGFNYGKLKRTIKKVVYDKD